jgi:hypothetical protein
MPETPYGPNKPHPLSPLKTELVWEGKYDEYGKRREVDIAGLAMPLQKIETVDELRSRALVQGRLFEIAKGYDVIKLAGNENYSNIQSLGTILQAMYPVEETESLGE